MYPLQSIILEALFVRKEKLFVSAVIKDNDDVIIWSKGHDYNAKSQEEKSFWTSKDKPEGKGVTNAFIWKTGFIILGSS